MKNDAKIFTLDELCALVGMNKRKIRFYIQKGLVDRPDGTGKGSSYSQRHLMQLLTVRKWKEAGLTLERIHDLQEGQEAADAAPLPPPRPKRPGAIEVWSHLHVTDGVEIHLEPQRAGLTPEQIRSLCRAVLEQFHKIKQGRDEDADDQI
jgi:DNA-binding transcriptional MerR regulator